MGTVIVSGNATVGEKMYAGTVLGSSSSVNAYQWLYSDNNTIGGMGSVASLGITNGTSQTFIVPKRLLGKWITCEVEFNDGNANGSVALGPVVEAGSATSATAATAAPVTRKSRRTYKVDTSKWQPSRRPNNEAE